MKLQEIKGSDGKSAGVFITMEDWIVIKSNYPDVDSLDKEIPEWQKNILEERKAMIDKDSSELRPISELLRILDSDV